MSFVDLDQNQLDVLLEFERNNWTWLQGEKGRRLNQKVLTSLFKMGLIERFDDTRYAYYFQRGGKKRYYITQGGLIAMWEHHGSKGEFPSVGKVGQVWITGEGAGKPPPTTEEQEQVLRRALKEKAQQEDRQQKEQAAAERLTERLARKEKRRLIAQAISTQRYLNRRTP